MSKPDTPGELRDVDVTAISLVSKAANGETFKIFKSADQETAVPEGDTPEGDTTPPPAANDTDTEGANSEPPAQVEKDEARGLFDVLKNFFVEKSGRKISGARLSRLKNIQAELNGLLSEIEAAESVEKDKGDDVHMTKEEMSVMVKGALDEAISPITERLEKLEKDAGEQPAEPETPTADIVKAAVSEAVASITERLERLEKARGVSHRIPEEPLSKSAEDIWAGLL